MDVDETQLYNMIMRISIALLGTKKYHSECFKELAFVKPDSYEFPQLEINLVTYLKDWASSYLNSPNDY